MKIDRTMRFEVLDRSMGHQLKVGRRFLPGARNRLSFAIQSRYYRNNQQFLNELADLMLTELQEDWRGLAETVAVKLKISPSEVAFP